MKKLILICLLSIFQLTVNAQVADTCLFTLNYTQASCFNAQPSQVILTLTDVDGNMKDHLTVNYAIGQPGPTQSLNGIIQWDGILTPGNFSFGSLDGITESCILTSQITDICEGGATSTGPIQSVPINYKEPAILNCDEALACFLANTDDYIQIDTLKTSAGLDSIVFNLGGTIYNWVDTDTWVDVQYDLNENGFIVDQDGDTLWVKTDFYNEWVSGDTSYTQHGDQIFWEFSQLDSTIISENPDTVRYFNTVINSNGDTWEEFVDLKCGVPEYNLAAGWGIAVDTLVDGFGNTTWTVGVDSLAIVALFPDSDNDGVPDRWDPEPLDSCINVTKCEVVVLTCADFTDAAALCDYITANPNSALATADCDNGGIDNATECADPTTYPGGPLDSADDAPNVGQLELIKASEYVDGTIVFTFTVTNVSGNGITINDIEIQDDVIGYNCVIGSLTDGQDNGTCTVTYTLVGNEPNPFVNTATVTGVDENGSDVLDVSDSGNSYDDTGGGDDDTTTPLPAEPLTCADFTDAAALCDYITANPNSALATADCDNGGIDNATECADPTTYPGGPLDNADDAPGCTGTVSTRTVRYTHADIASGAPFDQGINTGTYSPILATGVTTTALNWTYESDNLTGNNNPSSFNGGVFVGVNEYLDIASLNVLLEGNFALDYDHGTCDPHETILVNRVVQNLGTAQVGNGGTQDAVKTCYRMTLGGGTTTVTDNTGSWTLVSSSGGEWIYEICVDGTLTEPSGIWLPKGPYGPDHEGDWNTFKLEILSNECVAGEGQCTSTAGPGGVRLSFRDIWEETCCE